MERGPLFELLDSMKGSDRELDLTLMGDGQTLELRNIVDVEKLKSSHGLRITTKQNYIWLDAAHVSAAWQVRSDL